ncbi:MAG: thermonuclease family protein [Solirubrobacteraceae bacterium]
MDWRRAAPWLVVFAAVAALALRGLAQPPLHGLGRNATVAATVTRVVDGDTVKVSIAGRRDTVRYIGVDTPETHPGTPIQCFGEAATAYNRRLVAGRAVLLRTDAEPRDRYGRLLAYVYRRGDGLFVNAALVRRGLAAILTIPPNVAHAGEFRRLERRAREAGVGLWRACAAADVMSTSGSGIASPAP